MKLIYLLLLLFSSATFAGPIQGIEGPIIRAEKGKLLVFLKISEAVNIDSKFQIKENGVSFVDFSPSSEGGMKLMLSLDLDEVENFPLAADQMKSNTLADGRIIPGIPGGSLKNSLRIQRAHGFQSFHSLKSIGVAFPIHWNLGATKNGHHWLNWKGKNIGMISIMNSYKDRKAYGMIFLRFAAIRSSGELMKLLKKEK